MLSTMRMNSVAVSMQSWLFCSILYSMLQCYIASIRCYSTI